MRLCYPELLRTWPFWPLLVACGAAEPPTAGNAAGGSMPVGGGATSAIDDLNAQSLKFLNMIGQTAAKEIYIDGDKAHFTKQGATQMAKFVALELQRIGSPLAAYLK